MKLFKRNVELDSWNLATLEKVEVSEDMAVAARLLVSVATHEIGFAFIGEKSVVTFFTKDLTRLKEVVHDYTRSVMVNPPDFNTSVYDEEFGVWTMLTMEDCIQVIVPSELKLDENGNIDMFCALNGRDLLMDACEKPKVIGVLLPPEVECGNNDSFDLDLSDNGENNMEIRFGKVREDYGCFSNFYVCKVEYDGITYKNSEAAWQAQKTLDLDKRVEFSKLSGTQAKKAGRKLTLREDWEQVKYDLMVDILRSKFSNNPKLKEILLGTGDAVLVEDTTGWHDNTWGDCTCAKCRSIVGKNLLGKALMEVRKEL